MNKNQTNKKFIIVDCNHTDSHNMFNTKLIEKLAEDSFVFIFAWNNSYDDLKSSSVKIKKAYYLKLKSKNALLARFIIFVNTFLNALYLKYYNFHRKSITIIIGYEIISLSIISFLFPRKSYLIHHMQMDEIKNYLKRIFFLKFKSRFFHVVMTDYIKNYLIDCLNLKDYNVRVIPHPIYKIKKSIEKKLDHPKLFVSLSYSNNETFVNKLIEKEKKYKIFERNKCKLIIKSKLYNFTSPGLIVFNKYLSNEEYYELYNKSICVISLFDETFEYRISGTLIDAISAEKQVITLNSLCTKYYQSLFPHVLMVCKNIDEIIDEILNFDLKDKLMSSTFTLISNYNQSYSNSVKNSFY